MISPNPLRRKPEDGTHEHAGRDTAALRQAGLRVPLLVKFREKQVVFQVNIVVQPLVKLREELIEIAPRFVRLGRQGIAVGGAAELARQIHGLCVIFRQRMHEHEATFGIAVFDDKRGEFGLCLHKVGFQFPAQVREDLVHVIQFRVALPVSAQTLHKQTADARQVVPQPGMMPGEDGIKQFPAVMPA